MIRAFPIDLARGTAIFALSLMALAGCGGGADTVENDPTSGPSAAPAYSGPQAQSDDVQAFQREFWNNLRTKTCSSCHGTGGQAPTFMRNDDINLAYAQANPLVNRDNPALSVFVTKVAGGHNCWETSANACADQISRWISAWVGDSGFSGRQIQLTAPAIMEPTSARVFPASSALFEQHVLPLLQTHCASCHTSASATAQQPYFASSDPAEAYDAARSKMNLDLPAQSRFVVRLREESHNCWDVDNNGTPDCDRPNADDSADRMEAAIVAMQSAIPIEPFDTTLVASKALRLGDGTVAAGGNRYDANVIALYEFKDDEGDIAYDTSGVEPALHLTVSGADWSWVGGWGLRLNTGKAQGSTAASRKLHNLITLSGEYSIEAWVVPGNVAQEESRIVSYSGSQTSRNFMLGQTLYSYDFFARSSATGAGGDPVLTTDADDEDLQATLQHVVATFDPVNGRRIYVNGEFTGDADPADGGNLAEWDDSFAFVLGNEVSNNRQFQGTFRLVAVHNRALTQAQIVQNFEAGVGQKFYLLFNISERVNIPDAYILFEVSQYDSYGYLFNDPRFIILSATATPGSIPIRGMRIGINGHVPTVGQAYRTLDTSVESATYTAAEGQQLSNVGTVIGLERGPDDDQFFLTFDVLGANTDVRLDPVPLQPEPPLPVNRPPDIGLRTFEKISATMSKLTGVSPQTEDVDETYLQVKQAMPTIESIETFVSAQPVAIAQLAIQYCSAMVDDPTRRSAFFGGGFDVTANLGSQPSRDAVINPLIANMMGTSLSTQPDATVVHDELDSLIQRLCPGGCGSNARTATVIKATCTALLGSAVTLVN